MEHGRKINCNLAGREPCPPLAPPLGELAALLGAPLRGRHAVKKTVFPSLWYPLSQPDGCQLSQRESQEALPYLPANYNLLVLPTSIHQHMEIFAHKKQAADLEKPALNRLFLQKRPQFSLNYTGRLPAPAGRPGLPTRTR